MHLSIGTSLDRCLCPAHVLSPNDIKHRCKEKDNSFVRGLIGAGIGVALGNQIGNGSGKNWAKGIGAVAGYGIGKNVNKEDDDLTVCKERGYLITVVYEDNFGRMKYHEKRFNKPRRVGELIDFKF